MPTLVKFTWEITIFVVSFAFMFSALQRIDFSKLFKPNSTLQIKIVIIFISMATSFMIALGIGELVDVFINLIG